MIDVQAVEVGEAVPQAISMRFGAPCTGVAVFALARVGEWEEEQQEHHHDARDDAGHVVFHLHAVRSIRRPPRAPNVAIYAG